MSGFDLLAIVSGDAKAILTTLVLAAIALAVLGLAMSYVLGWANKKFHVDVDPKVEAINDALPGANCGGCGYVGCQEYAEAVASGAAAVDLCGPGGTSCAAALAGILGVDVGESYPFRAVVHCSATYDQRLQRTEYRGEQTCQAANLVAGVQGCTYGCLGLGDCVTACNYDAIKIENGLAVVDYETCIGCKACAVACPRNIITMVPFKSDQMLVIACSNLDMGPDVKAVCKTGCIGCKACTKAEGSPMVMQGNVPVIDYDMYDPGVSFAPTLDKCRMESLVFVGKPTAKDIAAAASEEMPKGAIKADFKTTADDAEWRG